jgi:4-alpha-glucanotransferase
MTFLFELNQQVSYGQRVFVCGSVAELGSNDEAVAVSMNCVANDKWEIAIDLKAAVKEFSYFYVVKDNYGNGYREWGAPRKISTHNAAVIRLKDTWQARPQQEFLYTSVFTDSVLVRQTDTAQPLPKGKENALLLNVECPYIEKNEIVALCGVGDLLGNWQPQHALPLQNIDTNLWQISFKPTEVKFPSEYKLLIIDKETHAAVRWEEGQNRILLPLDFKENSQSVEIQNLTFRSSWVNWRAAGTAIPVFSLRTADSFGIGEFPDLLKMTDWVAQTGQKIIQILPINDTTVSGKWTDSYPYSAISIFALHPIYLGLKKHPLADEKSFADFQNRAKTLNKLSEIDYEAVFNLKQEYIGILFEEKGEKTLKSAKFKSFFKQNEKWLFPYASFCYQRDKYQTSEITKWGIFQSYDKEDLESFVNENPDVKKCYERVYFVQFLLHEQLLEVKEYAHSKGVVLKGDIPIGINRNSVDAWTEPYLFNLDVQAGAPPDDFSVYGQNWGFPTYNWEEMARNGFEWWKNRFRKMADYFDAYRIDHILGFFRIWEIPQHSVQGLLGYFSPALPFAEDELRNKGFNFNKLGHTQPYIHEYFLKNIFGDYVSDVINSFLSPIDWQRFELKDFCNTQQKIKALFEGKTDEKSQRVRDGLYELCNEVLFIADKREPHKFHPRISAQYTYAYRSLDDGQKQAFNRLYEEFFYHRHNGFWYEKAMQKLPALVSSTRMLVCGEDLGMIPDCVPSVMCELQILSLEIQRMPKENNKLYENLNTIPYLSVCTTSTHDMSPLRLWWLENQANTQKFYTDILWKHGAAPVELTSEIAHQIVANHLNSPAMLVILPLQDWLSFSDELRNPNPAAERINIPANPQHYWRYRMHISLEELIENQNFNAEVKEMLARAER